MAPGGSLLLLLLLSTLTLSEKNKCQVCRDMTKHFQKHYDDTTGQNYGGGNTAWEERSLGAYAKSEMRFVEIVENTCGKVDYKCGSLLEDQEEYLDDWFFNKQESHRDVFQHLCVEHLEQCCPQNTFGVECAPCPGGTETPCSGFGKCKGEGDREGEGTCTCDRGYEGEVCEECKNKFVRAEGTCQECSSLCKGQCTAPGPAGCPDCINGYELVDGEGCTDINECERDGCGDPLEQCVNSPGSHECICNTGYHRVSGKCQLQELYADENESDNDHVTKDDDHVTKDDDHVTADNDHVTADDDHVTADDDDVTNDIKTSVEVQAPEHQDENVEDAIESSPQNDELTDSDELLEPLGDPSGASDPKGHVPIIDNNIESTKDEL